MADPIAPYDFEQMVKDEPKSSAPWIELIVQGERAFQNYNDRSDNVDKLYADMNYLANITRDRQFNLFWSNIEVLKPSIYARPPVPVVTTKFKDRRPVYRTASEFLERCSNVAFDLTCINDVMLGLRDDLAILARGAAWVRYETKSESDGETERVCIEWLHRRDFLHEPARNWPEVGWVARRGWMTLEQMKKRFPKIDEVDLMGADFQRREGERSNDNSAYNDTTLKAGVWEIWHKAEDRVVWVSKGVMPILDEDKPHLKLEGFFPAPKPAYATTERATLIPVPDVMQYKDQLEEINELTARIHALAYALQVRGFYPAGSGELGDAIESALAQTTNDKVLIGISNWAAFGVGAAKDSIVWLPTDMVATTITQCVELRRQMIDDVYQIVGLSDIQRGATESDETYGAQQLKNQNGSYRVRDKQNELIRIARDLVRIAAEIMAEKFSQKTLLEMSQMEMPTDAEIKRGVGDLEKQARQIQQQTKAVLEQAQADPEIQAVVQQDPQKAEQIMAKMEEEAQGQIAQLQKQAEELQSTVTIDQVMKFLRDNKIRPFVLDIETDSTIFPDENAEKQLRSEFLTAFGAAMQQIAPLVSAVPESASFAAEILRFALAPFRGGRVLDAAIDEFADQMIERSKQPQPPNPDVLKAQADAENAKAKTAFDMQKLQQEGQFKDRELGIKEQELQLRQQEMQMAPQVEMAKAQVKAQGDAQAKQLDAEVAVTREQAQLNADTQTTQMSLEAEALIEQQTQAAENARFMQEQAFKREELQVNTALAYDELAVQQQTAERAAEAKANAPKPNGAAR